MLSEARVIRESIILSSITIIASFAHHLLPYRNRAKSTWPFIGQGQIMRRTPHIQLPFSRLFALHCNGPTICPSKPLETYYYHIIKVFQWSPCVNLASIAHQANESNFQIRESQPVTKYYIKYQPSGPIRASHLNRANPSAHRTSGSTSWQGQTDIGDRH